MPTTTGFRFGDIVLVPFPFTDQTGIKKRPAVVISSDAYHRQAGSSGEPVYFVMFSAPVSVMKMTSSWPMPISPLM